ncbi:LysM peptidoglycan-binding domain-containing protein [Alkalibacillus silvisoli]|uniref:LysM domain-containing protein n=1 Tax=Alkalibacillus silvisoli TaxID=392823 RepID=A0ABP3JN95_9BACI
MSNYEQVPYQFEVREIINFKRGEEIDDLYSIAIDPDVKVIHESNYVQVRGVLVVRGDYQTTHLNQESQYIMDEDEQNTVQQVRTLDNGFMEFQYPIPIDITIPHNRIRTDDHIQVVIDYFDYELPESKTLKIYSNVRLDGTAILEAEERSDDPAVQSDFELKEFPTIEQEEPSYDDQDYETDEGHEDPYYYDSTANYNEQVNYEESAESDPVENEGEKGRDFWKKKEGQSLHEFFHKGKVDGDSSQDTSQNVEEVTVAAMNEPSDEVHDYGEEHETHDADEDTDTDTDTFADGSEGEEDEKKKESKPKKGLGYLSKFFREDEESSRVKMRMRFVQENDTLESIANYYQVSVSKLERLNDLEVGDSLKAGDVLYVPAEVRQSSE